MSKRSYMLVGEDAVDAQEQVAGLTWPDGSSVRMGDFGQRLKIAGLLFQGEGHEVLLLGPNAGESNFIKQTQSGFPYYPIQPDLETWCKVISQTDDPIYFEQNEQGMIKAVHRKVRAQISGGVQWEIFERDGFRCMYCGRHGGKGNPLSIDHFIPLSRGGANSAGNYLTCCGYHAKLKGDRSPEEFCSSIGCDYTGLKLYLEGNASRNFIAHLA